jgi:hypothetical protein
MLRPPMLRETYLRLTTQYGFGTKRGTGRTDHDTTPSHPVVYGAGDVNVVKYKVTPHTTRNPDVIIVEHKVTPHTMPNPDVKMSRTK